MNIQPRTRVRRPALLCALAAALFVLLACSSDGTGDDAADTVGLDVDGHEYWSTEVIEQGAPRSLVPDTRISLRFEQGRLSASAGCNSIGGGYLLENDTLVVEDLFMTEIGCDPARHDQDSFVIDTLMARPSLQLDAQELTLSTDVVTIRLLDTSIANPNLAIVGTMWTVDGFIDGDVAMAFAIDTPGHITFPDQSTMTGFDGCGEVRAAAEVSDGSIGGPVEADGEVQFGVVTRADIGDCGAPDYVEAFHRLFDSGQATIKVNGTNMTMLNQNGVGITFRADQ